MPIYSSREAKWYRSELLTSLEFDPRIERAAEALSGRRFIYGYFNGKLYIVVRLARRLDVTSAQEVAVGAGGYLATINSRAENDFVYEMSINDRTLWVDCGSCNDTFGPSFGMILPNGQPQTASAWKWITNEPITFTNWIDERARLWPGANFASFIKWRGKVLSQFHDKVWNGMQSSNFAIVIEID